MKIKLGVQNGYVFIIVAPEDLEIEVLDYDSGCPNAKDKIGNEVFKYSVPEK
jgi:hypothetical protein